MRDTGTKYFYNDREVIQEPGPVDALSGASLNMGKISSGIMKMVQYRTWSPA
jgi:hypothetical protein